MSFHSTDDSNVGVSLGHALCLIPDQYSISVPHIIRTLSGFNYCLTIWKIIWRVFH